MSYLPNEAIREFVVLDGESAKVLIQSGSFYPMTNTFSKRHGIIETTVLDPKVISTELRNRLWNEIKKYIDNFNGPNRDEVIKHLWDRFFKEDIDNLTIHPGSYTSPKYYKVNQIKEEFHELEWNRVYDFLEFLLWFNSINKKNYIKNINLIFIDEGAPYKIIGEVVTPLISGIESDEVKKAISERHTSSSNHLRKALELYSKRPSPDYLNSIKESISALEALAKSISKNQKATLGDLVGQLNIHSAFKKGIQNLYGWTSDEGGIRHSEKEKQLKVSENEARYMLVQCSALRNYIISKNEE